MRARTCPEKLWKRTYLRGTGRVLGRWWKVLPVTNTLSSIILVSPLADSVCEQQLPSGHERNADPYIVLAEPASSAKLSSYRERSPYSFEELAFQNHSAMNQEDGMGSRLPVHNCVGNWRTNWTALTLLHRTTVESPLPWEIHYRSSTRCVAGTVRNPRICYPDDICGGA